MNYIEASFEVLPVVPCRDILMAELAERGFESFVETETGLQAYIIEDQFREELLLNLCADAEKWSVSHKVIADENWNAEWEKNFSPIVIGEDIVIRAPFHPEQLGVKYDVLIVPKMSFGTGHHATTYLVMQEMLRMSWEGKEVLDMGSGTAILAILAEMRGADYVVAIDIDEWAYHNAIENVALNNCTRIHCIQGGAEAIGERSFDVVLANINRNILVRDAQQYINAMNPGAPILLSGFYTLDIPVVLEAFSGLREVARAEREEWALLHLIKE
jgi:ribosomal protein L11 methyltransferase